LYDLLAFRKHEAPGFTYESWATELGFKSRSFMTMILNKERSITAQFTETFCASMGFSETEKKYFQLLVSYNQTTEESEKSHYLDRLLEIRGSNKDLIEIRHHAEFLESTFLPQLLVLLSFKDIHRNVPGLSHFTKKNPEEIQIHLQRLQDMGLAAPDLDGEWIPTKKSFKIPKNLGSTALEKYHNHSLQEAIKAQQMPTEMRQFRSLLIPLSENDYSRLLQDFEALAAKVMAKYDSDVMDGKRLYKINFNLFPVSETHQAEVHKNENETRLLEKQNAGDTESII
jgi:uncharacterized protein (TIGR02147 family)